MAANPPEGTVSVEVVGSPEEGSGKKKSKFQAFKKLFVKKKRKESPAPSTECKLKPSQSSSDVSASGANETVFHPAQESVSKNNMGSKAVSHDSVFISEMENSTKEDTSQENTPGKVKALQLQLQQNIRIGSPPQSIVHKKLEDSGTLSEDDGLPRSPPEISSLHEILTQSSSNNFSTAQRRNSLSLGGTDSEDDPESGESSSCPISPQSSSVHLSPASQANHYTLVDFTSPPSSVACLDNSAAKHKIAVKPKKRRGLGMNVNCKKQEEGPYMERVVEKNDNEVVCEHEASIPQSGESSVEEDTPNKQVPLMEGEVVQVNTGVSLSSQEDLLAEATMDINSSVAYETSLADKPIMELYTEEDESDVDFHGNSVAMEDLVNGTEQTEIKKESIQLPQISEPIPQNEHEETTARFDPVEINDTKTEIVHLEVSEEQKCDISDNSINIEEDISVFETNESLDKENKDEKNDYEEMFPNLSELKFETLDISTFGTNVFTPQKEILKIESPTGIIKANEDVAFKSITLYNCTEAGNELNAETLPESSLSNAVTDEPGISDTPSSNKKMDNLDIKTESSKNFTVDSSVKCSTGSIHLASKIDCSGDNALSTKEPSSEASKTIKPLQENVDSKFTTSNRPVRFTVAPAWQRSFSVGVSAKESNFSKDKIACTSDSFDGSEKSGMEISQDNFKERQKNNEMVEASKDDSCAAFGVRLRRTSSSRKPSEDYSEEHTKQAPLCVDTAVSPENVQIPTKSSQVSSDFTKFSKPPHRGEDKPWQKKKSIDLSLQENSEPAWITMAKQKQKGFQEHPLARVTGVATDNDKYEESDESLQKNNSISSAQELEVKMIGPTSANSSASIEEVRPDSGKSTRSTLSEEPPWFSLAKKKAKAWSQMPPIVQ